MSQTLEKNAYLPGRSAKVVFFYAALVLAALVWFAPVITLVLTALKDAGDFAVNGAFSLLFTTTVLPAIRAGAALFARKRIGKFQGMIAATTP